VLITNLQIGYASGVRFWRNAGEPWPRLRPEPPQDPAQRAKLPGGIAKAGKPLRS
jgi:hypothetical protein